MLVTVLTSCKKQPVSFTFDNQAAKTFLKIQTFKIVLLSGNSFL